MGDGFGLKLLLSICLVFCVIATGAGAAETPVISSFHWQPVVGPFTANVVTDTNGQWGLSHPAGAVTLAVKGGSLVYNDAGESSYRFLKLVDSPTNPLVGSWYRRNALQPNSAVVLTFLDDSNLVFAQDSTPVPNATGTSGMERGTYTWNQSDGTFTVNLSVDTNGEWGLSHPTGTVTITVNGDILTYTDSVEGWVQFARLKESPTNPLVGTWWRGTLTTPDNLIVTTVLDDTTIILIEDGNPAIDPAGTDGIERATYTFTPKSASLTVPLSLTATGTNSPFSFYLSETPTPPIANQSGWVTTAPTVYEFSSEGLKTLYAWAIDALGNISESKVISMTINTAYRSPFASKIAVFDNGYWYLDTNLSWAWDGTPTDTLGIFGVGLVGAIPVAGDWNNDGKTEIGVFIDGIWYLDMNGNGQWDGEGIDVRGVFGIGVPAALPVVGDWNGDGKTKIGIFSNGIWYLDMNQNWAWDGEATDVSGYFGGGVVNALPVVGDWNGDGKTKIGIFSNGIWYLDMNQNWAWDGEGTDVQGYFGGGLPNVIPVTGDWNGDGITKIGVYSNGNWYMDKNRSWFWDGAVTDIYGAFGLGLSNAVPMVGNW